MPGSLKDTANSSEPGARLGHVVWLTATSALSVLVDPVSDIVTELVMSG